jgi:hypothetical protein
MKAIRPLLLVDYEPWENPHQDVMLDGAQSLVVTLPDGTLLLRYHPDGLTELGTLSAFERLTACEAVEP